MTIEFSVKSPTLPIPFHRLLKIVALVDSADPYTRELLAEISAAGYEVEVSDQYERDVAEDAAVGAYVARIDGDRLERGRALARAVRETGFQTPLWAVADTHRLADMAVSGLTGEVAGYVYLGQQTPTYYAKQIVASVVNYGFRPLPPLFGGPVAYHPGGNGGLGCPRPPGGACSPQSPPRP